jgi:hypothetical protein
MNTPNTPKAADAGDIPASLKREPPKRYEVHPIADIFPLLEGPAFDALVDDIRERGQQEPIWLYDGKIIDGRNRYLACQRLNRETKTREWIGDDPIGFVLGANLHRRHLNESQRAMVAAKLTDLEKGANQYTKAEGVSIDTASKLLNVGRASINRARKALATGDPALVAAVEKGNVSVSAAANQASGTSKDNTSKGKGRSRRDSPKDLKKQIDDFEAEWEELNGSQKRHFVKTNQHELAELLEELEAMIEEEEEEAEIKPSAS